jgi:PAS domain S-box-containing protein
MNKPQRKILIVDDSVEDRATYRRLLRGDADAEYLFEEVNTGNRGLAACETFQPDCLLLDYRLPDLDGLQFLRRLGERVGARMPATVMLTGKGNEAVAAQAMQCGAQDYLVKSGLTLERLRYTIANAIEKATLRRTLAAQHQQLQRQAEMIDNTHDAIITTDLDARVTSWNKGAERLFGYTNEEMIGSLIYHLFSDPEAMREQFPTLILAPLQEHNQQEIELLQRGKQGEPLHVQIRLSLARDQDGAPTGIVGYATDITARKHAEAALQESEARFRALINAAPGMAWAATPDGIMTLVSDNWIQYTGLTVEQLAGNWQRLVLHPDDYQRCEALWAQALAQGTHYEIEVRNRRWDGAYRWFLTRAVPMYDSIGRVTSWYGTTMDIHDRKLLEEEQQQFAYIVSHDLHEPLRAIANYTQLLARQYQGQLDATADDYIAFITNGAQRMKQMLTGLLEYTRAGKPLDTFTTVDCNAVLARVLATLEVAIRESGAMITHDPLPTVRGDAVRLAQVLQNLLSNAIKFRGAMPPQIHVSAQREARHWRFAVRDNGIGVDPAYAARLFQVFQRLHSQSEYPGTGIGLSICRRIVEQHNGRIWVESAVGQGATFYFTIGEHESESTM